MSLTGDFDVFGDAKERGDKMQLSEIRNCNVTFYCNNKYDAAKVDSYTVFVGKLGLKIGPYSGRGDLKGGELIKVFGEFYEVQVDGVAKEIGRIGVANKLNDKLGPVPLGEEEYAKEIYNAILKQI